MHYVRSHCKYKTFCVLLNVKSTKRGLLYFLCIITFVLFAPLSGAVLLLFKFAVKFISLGGFCV